MDPTLLVIAQGFWDQSYFLLLARTGSGKQTMLRWWTAWRLCTVDASRMSGCVCKHTTSVPRMSGCAKLASLRTAHPIKVPALLKTSSFLVGMPRTMFFEMSFAYLSQLAQMAQMAQIPDAQAEIEVTGLVPLCSPILLRLAEEAASPSLIRASRVA